MRSHPAHPLSYATGRDNFQRHIFFSNGATNSYGVMISFLGNKKIKCNKIRTDSNGRIIVLKAEIDDEILLLIIT